MILWALIAGLLLAAAAPFLFRLFGRWTHWVLAIYPAVLTVYFASFVPAVAEGHSFRFADDWVPTLGVVLSFYLDGLSLLFALLISGIGTFIVIYAGGYLHGHQQIGRFFVYLLLFMVSMLGVVLADNAITLFVAWELTSLTSFLLIGYLHEEGRSRRAAIQALVVTGGGGLALLAGLLLMGAAGGTLEISELNLMGAELTAHPLYAAMAVLVIVGCFAKSAQFPLHFWLPNAMEAPTPVSAYLHSATMVKAGVYLLARLNPGLGDTELWTTVLMAFGALTMVVGAVQALRQTDLKLVLAYTTVAGLGTLVMLIGIGQPIALKAAMVFLVTHALYKGGLFMVAGAVDHETGTRDPTRLGGLRGAMPITCAAAALAGLSMSGIPPFIGFIGKEFMYEATMVAGAAGAWLLTIAAITGNAATIAAAGVVAVRPFYGARKETPKHPHEAPPSLYLGPVVLAVLGLAAGVLHGLTGELFVSPGASSLAGAPLEAHLYLWHGFKPALGLSVITLAIGITGYVFWDRVRAALIGIERTVGWGPDRGYDQVIAGLERLARGQNRAQQTGYLRHYLVVTFTVATLGTLATMWLRGGMPAVPELPAVRLPEVLAIALTVMGAIAVTVLHTRIAAVAVTGVVGYGVALIFLLFSAPDLAFTQFMVETLVVVILVLVLMRLPLEGRIRRTPAARWRDRGIAVVTGGMFTLLLMAVTQGPFDARLSEYFAETSVPVAHGHNIVNVILVDFRALDTLGEIFVVTTAGLSAFALIRLAMRRSAAHSAGGDGERGGDA